MSVNSVILVDRKSGIGSGGLTATRIYQVETTDPVVDDEIVALGATGVPSRRDLHPTNTNLWVVNKTATPFEDRVHWRVQVDYAVKPSGVSGGEQHPWDLPANVSYFSEREQKAVDKAYGPTDAPFLPTKEIVNSAGSAFIDPVQAEISRMGIRIVMNVSDGSFDPFDYFRYINTLNADPVRIGGVDFGIHEGRMQDVQIDPAYDEDGDLYWVFTFAILKDTAAWVTSILDQGFDRLDNTLTPPQRTRILINGEETQDPVLLDGTGQPKATTAAATYLDFQTHLSESGGFIDWRFLGLPAEKDGVL